MRYKQSLWFYSNLLTYLPDMMSRLCVTLHHHKQNNVPYSMLLYMSSIIHRWNHSFCFRSSGGFQLYLSANCIVVWCIAIWPSTQNTIKILQRSLHSSRKMDKKVHRKQKPWKNDIWPRQILVKSQRCDSHGTNISRYLGVQWNMVVHLWREFLFYKLQTWPVRIGIKITGNLRNYYKWLEVTR